MNDVYNVDLDDEEFTTYSNNFLVISPVVYGAYEDGDNKVFAFRYNLTLSIYDEAVKDRIKGNSRFNKDVKEYVEKLFNKLLNGFQVVDVTIENHINIGTLIISNCLVTRDSNFKEAVKEFNSDIFCPLIYRYILLS